jgi:dTDP-4-dehydrorhamnose 3,5-epimerase
MNYKKFKNHFLKDNRGFLAKNSISNIQKHTKFKIVETFYSYFAKPNVVRGFYMQTGKNMEAKLLTLISGDLTWIIIDMRKKSKNFLKNYKIRLKKFETVYIPKGFAHGAISHKASLLHIFSNKKYSDKNSININWKDPSLNIKWPIKKNLKITLSNSHKKFGFLKDNKSIKDLL